MNDCVLCDFALKKFDFLFIFEYNMILIIITTYCFYHYSEVVYMDLLAQGNRKKKYLSHTSHTTKFIQTIFFGFRKLTTLRM